MTKRKMTSNVRPVGHLAPVNGVLVNIGDARVHGGYDTVPVDFLSPVDSFRIHEGERLEISLTLKNGWVEQEIIIHDPETSQS